MKHCQYCNSTSQIAETFIQVIPPDVKKQVDETKIKGPRKDIMVYTCEPCFDSQVWVDHDVSYSVSGEKVQA